MSNSKQIRTTKSLTDKIKDDCISDPVKIMSKIYLKAIDKVLEGKRVEFKGLGELKIYKKKYILTKYKYYRKTDRALNGYEYIVEFEKLNKICVKYTPSKIVHEYVLNEAVKRNLDFPLYPI